MPTHRVEIHCTNVQAPEPNSRRTGMRPRPRYGQFLRCSGPILSWTEGIDSQKLLQLET